MAITKLQFDVLTYLEDGNRRFNAGLIAKEKYLEESCVLEVEKELSELSFIKDGFITDKGIEALSPYKVDHALFIAAGFGSRMVPVTLKTPKPLVMVNGKRIIDTLIDAVLGAGINNITIVRGYLKEQFDVLKEKYPMIRFIDNPLYDKTNNISSGYYAKHLYKNSYVLEGDIVLANPKLITKYQYECNYLGVPVEKTDDWCLTTNEKGIVTKVGQGGENCHHLFGITYWNKEAGEKLEKHIDYVFNNVEGGRKNFWGFIPLIFYKDQYEVHVRRCSFSDIAEIDTFEELKAIDPSYENYK